MIERCGHWISEEQPEALVETILLLAQHAAT